MLVVMKTRLNNVVYYMIWLDILLDQLSIT